jgi:prophage regulatory protein
MTTTDENAAHDSGAGFYRLREVLQLVPVKKSSLFRWVQKKQFPSPYRLGPRASAWSRREVHEWCEARMKARDEEGTK